MAARCRLCAIDCFNATSRMGDVTNEPCVERASDYYLCLCFIQMGVQLFMFMHIGEGKDGKWQIGHTVFAIAIAVIIVIGSYFVLMTGHL